ncbi:carboxypeptidase-like regulatory domain-containing protein [Hymenobacter latericus]|uniref:carboxypeptidase-like regulatory domain-containing protein n=1 Tax=Hymenobacter sp. YIM 151858-1 TaxID=2987688 RepID=UPI0022262B61|nr:carboxypeptidase-like regulatory domain-containing protein [Hymenobacter sp. YIM 151858-1]UYZ58568.1 carboxypeptidase-like regulatory domain-containing protein [Hymenobacter sp. YIM 151858-1]
MKLTASPFHPHTGALLPVYRDAYLRGDLSRQHTAAVDAYLKANRALADETLGRFYDLRQQGEAVRPRGWVQRQLELIRTEPERLRRRAAVLVTGAALAGGAVMANANLPNRNLPVPDATEATLPAAAAGSSAAMRYVTVKGRILGENGQPLVGATVLDKATGLGAGTDAQGNYALRLPAGEAARLQFGYAGYTEEELPLDARFTRTVTLLPREETPGRKARRWWIF